MMDEILARKYSEEFNIPYELAAIVSKRFSDLQEAKNFLFPAINQLYDPEGIPDLQDGVEKVTGAIKNNKNILIYAHDDPDGYTSAAILYQTLLDIRRKSQPEIFVYTINREKDGYILNPEVLKEYIEKGVRVLITVDFGISNPKNFEIAQKMGLELVICDHHETELTHFPVPAVNPKRRDSKYKFRELAGAGVTLKFCQFIYKTALRITYEEFFNLKKELIVIAMLGTLADRVMPLNENRVICYEGLKRFNKINKPWAKNFLTDGNISIPEIFSEIIPLLQAAALKESRLGIDFFLDDDFTKVLTELKSIESTRRENIDYLFNLALDVAKVYPGVVISIIPDSAITPGQLKINNLGAVVSKLRDYFQRTAIGIINQDKKCLAELRSNEIDLFEFLNHAKNLFIDFGGHKRAAGFSMWEDNLDRFIEYATKTIPVPIGRNKKESIPEITLDKSKIKLLEPLLPFGEGNPSPLLTDGVDLYTIDNRLNIIELGLWQT
ncbi:MAG: DHH family phosphoesterase [candidate division WOR-3 bacterium]|nr:DHH family phosphoesterase [candidate division WOR-3 bacterium]